MSESDELLIARSRQGDREAFEELVRRTARMVFSRIYLETGDVHRTEDLVQDTFLTAWRSIRQVTDASGFRSWILTIAHSTTVDALRRDMRKKRSGVRVPEDRLKLVPATESEPMEQAERNEARRKVLSVLRSLPDEYRMPLMLRYIGGADYETIGRELGLSNGSLRGMLSRGLALLRSELARGGMSEAVL